jgi:hypothetical protein
MKQLSEIQSNTMFVQPKLPTFQIVVKFGGASDSSSNSDSAIDYDEIFEEALDKLDSTTQATIQTYLSKTTKYGCYPCSSANANSSPTDWYNFVKYCVITGNTSTLDTYALTWSQTGTGANATYNPTQDKREAALELYNQYVDDDGKTTGVKPECTTIDVSTSWTNNTQSASRV